MAAFQAVEEADLAAVERWFAATLNRCESLRGQQRHEDASNCAHGAVRMFRVLRASEAEHGFFSDFLIRPYEAAFDEYIGA